MYEEEICKRSELGCDWHSGAWSCTNKGEKPTCERYYDKDSCPTDECVFDELANICHHKDKPVDCMHYYEQEMCAGIPSCAWDSHASTCRGAGWCCKIRVSDEGRPCGSSANDMGEVNARRGYHFANPHQRCCFAVQKRPLTATATMMRTDARPKATAVSLLPRPTVAWTQANPFPAMPSARLELMLLVRSNYRPPSFFQSSTICAAHVFSPSILSRASPFQDSCNAQNHCQWIATISQCDIKRGSGSAGGIGNSTADVTWHSQAHAFPSDTCFRTPASLIVSLFFRRGLRTPSLR